MSLPEVVLWQALRGSQIASLRFRRQHPVGPYIADFYCAASRLVVEIDGASHSGPDQERHDRARDRWMAANRVRVLRISASHVLDDEALGGVLVEIEELAAAAPPPSTGDGDHPRVRPKAGPRINSVVEGAVGVRRRVAPAPLPAFGRTPPVNGGRSA
jgi:very-short-patch-repair endonuclease